jgi:hypothetical protein
MALAMGTVVGNDSSRSTWSLQPPAEASGCDTILFGNSAQEWPEPFPQLRVQQRDTLFGAENTMNIERAKGVCHGQNYILAYRRPQHVVSTLFYLGSNLSRDRFNRPAGTGLFYS